MTIELETRAPLGAIDHKAVRLWLVEHAFDLIDDVFQTDIIFDRPDGALFLSGSKIRLRDEGRDSVELTYKGSLLTRTDVSEREEVTLLIARHMLDDTSRLLTALGFPELFRTPKRRVTLRCADVQATLDRWPIAGWVIEARGKRRDHRFRRRRSYRPHSTCSFATTASRTFALQSSRAGKSVVALKAEYESEMGLKLGMIDLLGT